VLEPDLVLAWRQISDCPHAVGIDDGLIDLRLEDVPAVGRAGLRRDVECAHFVDRAAGGLIQRDAQRTAALLARANCCGKEKHDRRTNDPSRHGTSSK